MFSRLCISLTLCAAMASAQATPSPAPAAATPSKALAAVGAANAVPGSAFASVNIRPANIDPQGQRNFGIQFTPTGALTFSAMSLKSLVMFAYSDGREMQLVNGGPKWADSDQYDIHAQLDKADLPAWEKLPGDQRFERLRTLIQTMLQQRFNLKGHTATISTPANVLVQAKGGSKLKVVPTPTPAELQEEQKRRQANNPADPPQMGLDVTPTGWVGHSVRVPELMGALGYALSAQDKPFLDQTGLTGYYDFTLKIIKQEDGPSPAQQVEDQLGLKLESRNAPIKTFVIDSAEKPAIDPADAAPPPVVASAPPPPHIHFDVVSWKRCAPGC